MDEARSGHDPGPVQGADLVPAVINTAPALIGQAATALISLGGLLLGIPVTNLREVMVHPPSLQPLPSGGPFATGCVPLRGQVIPVLDLSAALKLPAPPEGPCIIAILRWENRVVGLRAQEVRRIVQPNDVLIQELAPAGSDLARNLLPGVALVGNEVVSLLDSNALLAAPDVPHSVEHQTRSRHLDRSGQFILCEIEGWRYCVAVGNIEGTLAETVVDNSVLFHGACEGVIERNGLKTALMNPKVYTGFSSAGDRLSQSGGIVLKLDAGSGLILRADRITDILLLQPAQITPVPAAVCARSDLFQGVVFDAAGAPCYVLDITRLVAETDVLALASIACRKDADRPRGATSGGGPKGVAGTAIFVRAAGLRALAIQDVDEILPLPLALSTALPRHDGFVGSIFYREALLPVFCMSCLAGVTDPPPGQRPAIVVVRKAGERVGLLVQDIVGIERVQFVEDVPEVAQGPATRLAVRHLNAAHRFVAVWQWAQQGSKVNSDLA